MASIVISHRTTSGFPVSIATSSALETLFDAEQAVYDPGRIAPEKIDVTRFSHVYFNLDTLYRNLIMSIDREVVNSIQVDEVEATLEQEMEVIVRLFDSHAPEVKPVFYISSFKALKKHSQSLAKYKLLQLRVPHTEHQLYYEKMKETAFAHLQKKTDEIMVFEDRLKAPKRTSAIALTHYPYDLLSHADFEQLLLLESNTGVVKDRKSWYTKFHPIQDGDMSFMPFLEKTLYLFGDRSLIRPGPLGLRREIYALAKEHKLHALSTEGRLTALLNMSALDPSHVAAWKAL